MLAVCILLGFQLSARDRSTIKQGNTYNVAPTARKGTSIGGTDTLKNLVNNTLTSYTWGDTGYVFGPNTYGDRGFAERYDFNANDSSLQILGLVTQFTGSVNVTDTTKVNLKCWAAGHEEMIAPRLIYNGFPSYCYDTLTVPVTSLGVNSTRDTTKVFLFAQPSAPVNVSFFAGFDFVYNPGTQSKIGLKSTTSGFRNSPATYLRTDISFTGDTTIDTIVQVQNAMQFADGSWHDVYTETGLLMNLCVFPIVAVKQPTALPTLHAGNLSLLSVYPNPSSDVINIGFSVVNSTTVTISILDFAGRQVKFHRSQAVPGSNSQSIDCAGLENGNYIILVRAGENGIATPIVVMR